MSANGVQRIEKALRPVMGNYDFIVLDTGPNLSHLTLGALVASQHIIIPVSATVWSTTGLRKFIRWIDDNREDEIIDAELLGLLATMVMARTRIGRDVVEEMSQSLPELRNNDPKAHPGRRCRDRPAVAGEPGVDEKFSEAYIAFAERGHGQAEHRQEGSAPCLTAVEASSRSSVSRRHSLTTTLRQPDHHRPSQNRAGSTASPGEIRTGREGSDIASSVSAAGGSSAETVATRGKDRERCAAGHGPSRNHRAAPSIGG